MDIVIRQAIISEAIDIKLKMMSICFDELLNRQDATGKQILLIKRLQLCVLAADHDEDLCLRERLLYPISVAFGIDTAAP